MLANFRYTQPSRKLNVPEGLDVVIHCGDESVRRNEWLNEPEAREFFDWYSALDVSVKIFVPGNHSMAVEKGVVTPEQYPGVRFLIHEQTELEGLVVFGTPCTPKFFDWAYMRAREDLDMVWRSIPDNVDILISHGSPKVRHRASVDSRIKWPLASTNTSS